MLKIEYDKDLRELNTFGMRVRAKAFAEYDSVEELVELLHGGGRTAEGLSGRTGWQLPEPFLHIGSGSNLLFTGDFPGTVLHSRINYIKVAGGDRAAKESAPKATEAVCDKESAPEKTAGDSVFSRAATEGVPVVDLSADDVVYVSVGSGVVLDDFCKWAAEHVLWGAENLSHIPGEAGASAVQNVGAYGVEVKDIISKVCCYDMEDRRTVEFAVDECAYAYRDSVFKHAPAKGRYIITEVQYRLSRAPQPRLDYGHLRHAVEEALRNCPTEPSACATGLASDNAAGPASADMSGFEPANVSALESIGADALTPALVRRVVTEIRRGKLPEPSELGSAGSFFKNPVVPEQVYLDILAGQKAILGEDAAVPHYMVGDGMVKIPAAWLIEQCGWKGRRCGGAAVYEKQPLVLVNRSGNALPEEILKLESQIVDSVLTRFGIRICPEVEHI